MMTLALIVAVAANGVIGRNGTLPWRLPEDLRHFRKLTTGHAIIMGRRTWDSLPRALPDRQNIVVSRQAGFHADGAIVVPSLEAALAAVVYPSPPFCIGGGELFRAALPLADTAYETEIARAFEGDATFPALDSREWIETSRETHVHGGEDGFEYAFVSYQRREH
ncbi:MAG TPA: dihydrofolate reductase [Casimicrobiaceae bacterium]|nr:dihydrofolate reductase [Casimicrobiaceae bacterium]